MFIDCLVQAGSNPAVMLVKELIETKEITGNAANLAMSSLGYYVKTPTRELLFELIVWNSLFKLIIPRDTWFSFYT